MTTLSDLINDFTLNVVELCASKGYDMTEGSDFMLELGDYQDNLKEDIKDLLLKIAS
jgi:hypothetical protein